MAGERVGRSGGSCYETQGLASGLYLARVEVSAADGSKRWMLKKLAITP